MLSKALSALVFASSLLSVSAIPTAAPISPCAAVNIIAARASTEAPGPGIIGALVAQVQRTSTQTISNNSIDYPATLNNYASSSAQGTQATISIRKNLIC